MIVSFVRIAGKRDRIYAHRTDGSEASWEFPTYGDELPHDLVHLVVEAAFGLGQGFWGRVDAGVDPARVNEEANRSGGADKYRGFGEDRREILLAEALAGIGWVDAEVSDARRREAIAENCEKVGVGPPETVSLERIAEVHRALARLRERWRELGKKGTLVLGFDPRDPRGSFERIVSEAG